MGVASARSAATVVAVASPCAAAEGRTSRFSSNSKFKVQSSKLKVESSKFKVQSSKVQRVQSSKFKGSKFQVPSSKFKVQKFGSSSVRPPPPPSPYPPLPSPSSPSSIPPSEGQGEGRGSRSKVKVIVVMVVEQRHRSIGARFFLPLLFIGTFSSSGTWGRGGGRRGAVCTEGSCRNGRRKAEGGRVKLRGHSCPRPQDFSAHHTSRS